MTAFIVILKKYFIFVIGKDHMLIIRPPLYISFSHNLEISLFNIAESLSFEKKISSVGAYTSFSIKFCHVYHHTCYRVDNLWEINYIGEADTEKYLCFNMVFFKWLLNLIHFKPPTNSFIQNYGPKKEFWK